MISKPQEVRKQRQEEVKQHDIRSDGGDSITPSHKNPVHTKSTPIISYAMDDDDTGSMIPSIPSIPSTALSNKGNKAENDSKDTAASISIADCLACSGCITSSEAVLVTTQHSIETLKRNCSSSSSLENADSSQKTKRIVFTISPAVIADLVRVLYVEKESRLKSSSSSSTLPLDMKTSAKDNDTSEQIKRTYQRLTSFLHQKLNASLVLDGMIPQQIALTQSAIEFCIRYRYLHPQYVEAASRSSNFKTTTIAKSGKGEERKQLGQNDAEKNTLDSRILDINTPSIALSATETRYLVRSKNEKQNQPSQIEGIEIKHETGIDPRLHFLTQRFVKKSSSSPSSHNIEPQRILPMLASSCPGFVCYVEKTTPDIITNMCTVKSPMAIAGSIFKHGLLTDINGPTCSGHDHDYGLDVVEGNKQNKEKTLDHNESSQVLNQESNTQAEADEGVDTHCKQEQIYHVAIMPCHDKKLEAERKDFAFERFMEQEEKLVSDVDLVITTNELFAVLMESAFEETTSIYSENAHNTNVEGIESCVDNDNDEGKKIRKVKEYFESFSLAPTKSWKDISSSCEGVYVSSIENNEMCTSNDFGIEKDIDWSMKGSGSYAEFIFRFASLALFGHYIPMSNALPWKSVSRRGSSTSARRRRNLSSSRETSCQNTFSDYSEVSLYQHSDGTYSFESLEAAGDSSDRAVLNFATSYGFKNIQLLIQRMKSNKMDKYHYVETMACPSGCLNGGGQIKSETVSSSSGNDILGVNKRKEKPSEKRDRIMRGKSFVLDIFPPKNKDTFHRVKCESQKLLHTRYHVVPKLELTTGSIAGVKVDDTNW